jgi:hypothetical protein
MKNIKKEAEVTGLKADTISKGSTHVEQQANHVEGKMIGVEVKNIK